MSNNKHGNLQHGRLFSAVALTYNSETEEKKRRNRKRWEMEGLDETKFVRALLRFVLFVFSIFVSYRWSVPNSQTIVNRFDI